MKGKTMFFWVVILCTVAIMAQPSVSNASTYNGAWGPENGTLSADLTLWSGTGSFYMYDWNNIENNLLLFQDGQLVTAEVKFNKKTDSDGFGWYAKKVSGPEIFLGPNKEFGFYFWDGSTKHTQYTVTPSPFIGGYILTKEFPAINGGGIQAMSVGIKNANPVPIPASALLLGSGIVGLIGFGKRMRKKNL